MKRILPHLSWFLDDFRFHSTHVLLRLYRRYEERCLIEIMSPQFVACLEKVAYTLYDLFAILRVIDHIEYLDDEHHAACECLYVYALRRHAQSIGHIRLELSFEVIGEGL